MEHKNEFLMGMFAAYYGSPILETHSDGDTITDVIDWEFISRYQSNDVEGKPILTPLSEITDEDAVEVAKIARCRYQSIESIIVAGRELVTIYLDRSSNVSAIYWVNIIDYLRSKQYDCGYMHLPSLITAGLAIKKSI